jgi:hypothetical protein
LLCAVTFFNDMVMRGTFLVGNFLPITVFGSLILFVLLINPLLRLAGRGAVFSGKELALIVTLVLFACYIPGRGLMHEFTTFLMLPHHYQKITPGWQGEPARVMPEQVSDWRALADRLEAGRSAGPDSGTALIWSFLPGDAQAAALAGTEVDVLGPGIRDDLLNGLNALIADPAFAEAVADSTLPLPRYARRLRDRGSEPLSDSDRKALCRAALDSVLSGVIAARQPAILDHAPARMLADPSGRETVALDGFVNGLGTGDAGISFNAIPWGAWRRALLFWVPLILTLCAGIVGLSLVIHRQWATHERLPYPTIEFARSLLPEPGHAQSSIFRNRLFWIGTILVFALHMNNYAYVWWPEYLVRVRTRFDFNPVLQLFPIFQRSGVGVWTMFNPTIYFTVIGFAYFLSTDVSLSLGIAPYVYAIFTGTLIGYGVSVNGAMLQPYIGSFFYAGAYAGMFLVLVYTGRQYFGSVLKRSLFLRSGDAAESHAVWGGRVFLLAALLFIVQLTAVGLSWQLAALYTMIMTVLFVVISRLLAEAGVFYLHAYFFPCAVLWGFLGAKAIGPDQLLIMSMLSSVLLIDPREAFMPFVVSGLQLSDQAKCRLGRTAVYGMLAVILGFAAALPATIYLQYRHGAIRVGDGWTTSSVPRFAFNASSAVRKTLVAQGALPAVDLRSGWARLADATPTLGCVLAFATTFVLVILFTMGRHRFSWWPIHPLLFLVLATWQSRILAFSFLIGWAVKKAVTKYGGADHYQKLKPLMIGLVTGEMLAGIVPMIIGAVYYWVQGEPPKSFAIYR